MTLDGLLRYCVLASTENHHLAGLWGYFHKVSINRVSRTAAP